MFDICGNDLNVHLNSVTNQKRGLANMPALDTAVRLEL